MPFTIPTERQVLLSTSNSKQVLTPRQKFEKANKEAKRKKYHFKAIEHGSLIFLYSGLGKELKQFDNNFSGNRECRAFAFDFYMNAEDRFTVTGGYYFDFIKET